jgi:hypothetical protein
MAQAGKLRVNLKDIRKPLDAIDAKLTRALKSPDANRKTKAEVRELRTALRKIRQSLANNCCDGAWFCDFDV